jgi:alpha-ketoglutarate-dependent taurine dioxygenase
MYPQERTEIPLPLMIDSSSLPGVEPGDSSSFVEWFERERATIEEMLLQHGALLFRQAGVSTPAAFGRFVKAVTPATLDYVDGNSPRTRITRGVYTSTEYPAQYFISLHNELSYSHHWPSRIFFCCVVAAAEGGATVVADSREILRRLDPALVEEFTRRRIEYIRNLHGGNGLGPSWQDTFEMTDRKDVEELCQEAGMAYEWRPDGGLRVRQIRPAVAQHPQTGEIVWFNQADQFHPSTHPPDIYAALQGLYGDRTEDLPQNVRFGDGGEIPVESLDAVREAARASMVPVAWQEGDLLMVDNVLVAHGRMPFAGQRKILVAMS